MDYIKPQIPEELSNIIVGFNDKITLKNYFANAEQYPSYAKYINKYSSAHKSENEILKDIIENSRQQLIDAHEVLWANKKHALLIILQGMDTAGKDGTIKHVLSGLNPRGCTVANFKVPSTEEHEHNFLWRYSKKLPSKGDIVIFNRSHYEDVLVTKIHPECMETLPDNLSVTQNKNFWQGRYEDISAFEKHLARNGVLILKFFLYISKDEQKARLLKRLNNKDKLWKASRADIVERGYWDNYITAYEDMLSNTSRDYAPWIVVPANNKKISHAIVAHAIAGAVKALKIQYPTVSTEDIAYLNQAKKKLEAE